MFGFVNNMPTLSSLLQKQREEFDSKVWAIPYGGQYLEKCQQELLEAVEKEIEGKRRKEFGEKYNSSQEDIDFGYNEALSDIKEILKR